MNLEGVIRSLNNFLEKSLDYEEKLKILEKKLRSVIPEFYKEALKTLTL